MNHSDEDPLLTELIEEAARLERVQALQHAKNVEFCRQFGIRYADAMSPMRIAAIKEAIEKQRASGITSATSIPEKSPFLCSIPMHQSGGKFLFHHPQVAEFGVEPDENPDLSSESSGSSTGNSPAKRLPVKYADPLYLKNWIRRYQLWNNDDGILGLHYLKDHIKPDEGRYAKRLVDKLHNKASQRNFDNIIDSNDEMGDLPERKSAITNKRKKNPLPPHLKPWLNKFKAWTHSERHIALKELISNLKSPHIIYMKKSFCPSEVTTSISSFASRPNTYGSSFQSSATPLLIEQSSSTTSNSQNCQAKDWKSPATATSLNEIPIIKIRGGRVELAERRQAGQ